ncbi:MAG TPA: hypothetical protein DDX00_10480 [Acinetobacter radioresistens]|nr:hypothetical protein [Acinetobacter radioresistens]
MQLHARFFKEYTATAANRKLVKLNHEYANLLSEVGHFKGYLPGKTKNHLSLQKNMNFIQ